MGRHHKDTTELKGVELDSLHSDSYIQNRSDYMDELLPDDGLIMMINCDKKRWLCDWIMTRWPAV
jgi:hypothetical protein